MCTIVSLDSAGSSFVSPGMVLWAKYFTEGPYPANMIFAPSTSDNGYNKLLSGQVDMAGL